MHVLIVEDSTEVIQQLSKALRSEGYKVTAREDGNSGLAAIRAGIGDVVVLDRMLPGMDGLELLRTIRSENIDTRVLILSSLATVDHKVKGLRAGGDDYLAKPFEMEEAIARIETLLRRSTSEEKPTRYTVGNLVLDRLSHEVVRGGVKISLQPREYRLLEYLMQHEGRVVTRKMLLENVWEYHFDPETNVVDVHVSRLRNKIEKGFDRPLIKTIRGAGYMIRDEEV